VPEPLNELLASAIDYYTREFTNVAAEHASLELHANLLRLVPDSAIDQREIPELARVSKRAVRNDVTIARRRGWVAAKGKQVELTDAGRRARDVGERSIALADAAWQKRFGKDAVARSRRALEALVQRFDLELPHYPTGYGPADGSVTGGVAMRWGRGSAFRAQGLPGKVFDPVAERDLADAWEKASGGRLYVRETGQDWRPVPRADGDTVSSVPLHALLSQALMAFAIDYEGCGGLSIARSGNRLRGFGDEGVEVAVRMARSRGSTIAVPAIFAGLERHGYAELAVDPNDKKKGRLTLSEKGVLIRDAYDEIVVDIERRWKSRYGAAVVRECRSALKGLGGRSG